MSKRSLLIVLLTFVLTCGFSFGQFAGIEEDNHELSGFVFNDLNKNRKFDTFEKGIAGVLVSNGVDVVETDNNGKYSLVYFEGSNIIFAIKPSAWKVPLSFSNLPEFYHGFIIEKSEDSGFPGTKTEPQKEESYNFPLYKTEVKDNFEFIALADPQSRKHIELYYLRDDIVSELIYTTSDFSITLGDIMYDDLSLFDRHNEIMSKLGIPSYNVAGNHDINYEAPDDKDALTTYNKTYGPSYYAFEYGQANFIVLDDVEWKGKSENGHGGYRGFLGSDQLEWIRNYLEFVPEENLIVLAMHIPLYYFGSDDDVVNVVNREELLDILASHNNVLALAGHMHMVDHSFLDESFGWNNEKELHQITCSAASGSWWTGPKNEKGIPETIQRDGVPNGYHLFSINGTSYQEYHKAAGKNKNFQMRIVYPTDMLCRAELDTMKIIVNVFNGSEKSIVEYNIDNNDAVKMERTLMKDTYCEEKFSKPDSEYHKNLRALETNHIWTSEFPLTLPNGEHTIRIRTIDFYGNEYTETMKFELQ